MPEEFHYRTGIEGETTTLIEMHTLSHYTMGMGEEIYLHAKRGYNWRYLLCYRSSYNQWESTPLSAV
ncbi:hypothetical protein C4D60_Mb00t17600 [Musa balbisiana]|uniref:Uncharacterized protein n=1 Tax=Musa balbisiana TaxID=52838 RepID=A0A4S8I628_MUSBA|nr:hypothetical protein C4D60_Mb00t17600 [Musa balbisiana]